MKHRGEFAQRIIESRKREFGPPDFVRTSKGEDEGGCGVTGFACNIPIAGRHIFEPSVRMHNRGNGKGGGIAAVGFDPDQLGVSRETLDTHYMVNVAILDAQCLSALKEKFITPFFNVASEGLIPHVEDYRDIEGIEIRPPDVWRAFVRVKPEILRDFIARNRFEGMPSRWAEDEFVSRNSFKLNKALYSSLGFKQAFVLSHGRNMMILKIVGYAEQVVQYYMLDDTLAHVWIAHQRYPTRGRVWHPGGAHPFAGLNEALVHNGDFANYHATCEYLKQRGMEPLFMTDTEVSVLLFDLWHRLYGYPLEVIIEALAPTGELDFDLLPEAKRRLYETVQTAHIHASPDGPWFFIVARNIPGADTYQLLGVTDTSMLRPQVFSLYDGEAQIGLICSEKQAIDATLRSLAQEDPRFSPVADKYWNARGGSSDDGGAFIFNVVPSNSGGRALQCVDKFGNPVTVERREPLDVRTPAKKPDDFDSQVRPAILQAVTENAPELIFELFRAKAADWDFGTIKWVLERVGRVARRERGLEDVIIRALTLLLDRRIPLGGKKRSGMIRLVQEELYSVFRSFPRLEKAAGAAYYCLVDYGSREALRPPQGIEVGLVVEAADFPPEGDDCDAVFLADAYRLGWRRFIVFDLRGQRFEGCGFGPATDAARIHLYGSSGDYIACGIDGMEVHVHGNAQDQVGQILKKGLLVIHGDVGQCFLYGAKGGDAFVLGNAAGRPLINAAGKPRVVINGAALDFLAESFMAGDPHKGGGFVIVNGLRMDEDGNIRYLERPYPGSNLFSLASGGALFVRDPHRRIVEEQLNGGRLAEVSERDWRLILPYLEMNEELFGITVDELLTVDGVKLTPSEVYIKVEAVPLAILRRIPETDDTAWGHKKAAPI
jgi:glutamate synthase domain-containing protein 1